MAYSEEKTTAQHQYIAATDRYIEIEADIERLKQDKLKIYDEMTRLSCIYHDIVPGETIVEVVGWSHRGKKLRVDKAYVHHAYVPDKSDPMTKYVDQDGTPRRPNVTGTLLKADGTMGKMSFSANGNWTHVPK